MLDRSVAPPFSKNYAIQLPALKQSQIGDGVPFLSFDHVRQALTKIDVVFKAGKWNEALSGVSHFTAQMIEKGTKTKTAAQIAETFDLYGAHVDLSPGFDFTTVSLYTLNNKLHDVLPLFTEILSESSFPENELNLMKTIFIQNLKVNNEKNNYVASKLIRKNIFGDAHPYGNSIEEKDVAEISSASTLSFFNAAFHPFEIYVTGQLDERITRDIAAALERILNKNKNPETQTTHIASSGDREVYLEKPESIQTSIRMGKRCINKNHPDYFGFLLLNHILGGYFGSRLMKNIREEKGLSYGIYSSINAFVHEAFFVIGADVNKNNQELTVQEINNELNKLITQPIGEQELDIAKSHLLGSIQLDMANPFSVVEKIKNIRLNGLSDDHYNNLFKQVGALTSHELMDIANKYLQPADLSVVKVG